MAAFRDDRNLSRTVTLIAGTAALLIAVLLPLVYFLQGKSILLQEISLKASVKAELISQVAAAAPDVWHYQDTRLVELLTRSPAEIGDDFGRVLTLKGRQIVSTGKPVVGPALSSAKPVLDAGLPVGQVEVVRSMQELLANTGALALLGAAIGALVFVTLRVLPLRALQAATHSLAAQFRYQEQIARFGQSALGKREPSELIEEAVQKVREGLAGGAVAYVEPGPGERQLVLLAVEGLREGAQGATAAYAGEAPIARVLEAGQAVRVAAGGPFEVALPFEWARSSRRSWGSVACVARCARCRRARAPWGRRRRSSSTLRRACYPPACGASTAKRGSRSSPSSMR